MTDATTMRTIPLGTSTVRCPLPSCTPMANDVNNPALTPPATAPCHVNGVANCTSVDTTADQAISATQLDLRDGQLKMDQYQMRRSFIHTARRMSTCTAGVAPSHSERPSSLLSVRSATSGLVEAT